MWLREEQRLKSAPWAVLAFGIVGAFLLFHRPPKPDVHPLVQQQLEWLNDPGLLHPSDLIRRVEVNADAARHPEDETQVAELLQVAENANPPPVDLARIRRLSRLLAETNEGGLYQFFYTEAGADAEATVADLRAIGAEPSAAILEAACRLFPKGKPNRDHVLRRLHLERLDEDAVEELNTLENRFQSREESIAELLRKPQP